MRCPAGFCEANAERGYRMITGMLNNSGWHVNHKRPSRGLRADHCRAVVERI
jgi:putative transposase